MTDLANIPDLPPLERVGVFTLALRSVSNLNDARSIAALITLACTTISPVFASIFSLLAAGFVFSSKAFSQLRQDPMSLSFIVALIAALLATSLVVIIQREVSHRRLRSIDDQREFDILQAMFMCVVVDSETVVYRQRYYVRARHSGADHFSMRFAWSSSSPPEIRLKNKSFSHIIERVSHGYGERLRINLNYGMVRGGTEVVEFDVIARGGKPLPYYGITYSSPKFPFLNTTLIAVFMSPQLVGNVYKRSYFAPLTDQPYRSAVIAPDENGRVTWHPMGRLGWRYNIEWQYN